MAQVQGTEESGTNLHGNERCELPGTTLGANDSYSMVEPLLRLSGGGESMIEELAVGDGQ